MAFYSRRAGGHNSSDSFWTSYSDLFLGLSSIFLLLYVVSSLRTGADTLRQQIENEQMKTKLADLQNQLKFYEESKNEYMKKSASADEVSEYQELMDKLNLLQEESKSENAKLRQQIIDNNTKEKALNKYQQMVRNVINSSKFEKVKVTNRDTVISEKNVEIETQNTKIEDLQADLSKKKQALAQTEAQIDQTSQQLAKHKAELAAALKSQKITKKIYEQKLAATKLDSDRKMAELAEQQGNYKKQIGELSGQMQNLGQKLKGVEGELNETKGQLNTAKGELDSTKGELSNTKGQLAKAQAEIDARKGVAKQIKASFAAKGIKAEVDMDSGEVYLDFGESYFESGSAALKKEMKDVIEKAVPLYAQNLLGNPKIADKVSSIEIVGFASPTYKGKFVDPNSSKTEDQDALKYNMDLSYKRAKSIFDYVLDEKKMNFKHQKEFMPLLKVSGRSFLESAKVNRAVTTEDFCKVNDCKKAQRVVIRFSMDKKK